MMEGTLPTMEEILASSRRSSVGQLRPSPSFSHPVTFRYQIQHHTTRMQKLTTAFQVYRLTVMTLICVVAGLVIGLISRPFAKNWTERQFMYIEIPGELYLRFLKLMIVPLIVSNVILSFGTIQGKLSTYLAKVASFLYLGSNLMAIAVAILVALIMSPGKRQQTNSLNEETNPLNIINHHLFNDYHNSINRYREYHPMFYHTDRGNQADQAFVVQQLNYEQHFVDQQEEEAKQNSSSSIYSDIQKKSTSTIESTFGATDNMSVGQSNKPKDERYPIPNPISEVHRVGLNTKLPIDVLLDVLRNLVPDSIIGATMQRARTRLFAPKELVIGKNGSTDPPPSSWPMGHEMIDQTNVIGLLAVSILTGVMLSHMEEASKPILDLCACVAELSLRIGMLAINLTPICIMFLLIGQVARARDLSSMAGELFMYSITVIIALLIHGFVLLPLVYYLITRKSPIKFLLNMIEALIAAFATSSSSATMALMLNCLEVELNPVIVKAFGPLGSVFNMNGTAIFEAIGAIFIAQIFNVTLPLTSILLIGFSSAVASLSTTGIPSSGMMTLVIVLNAVNLPVLQLSLIYIVDFIIDRFRTVVNVWSAAIVCGLIDHICPEHLFEEEMKPEKYLNMVKNRKSRATLSRKSSAYEDDQKPQVISVTITPPLESCV